MLINKIYATEPLLSRASEAMMKLCSNNSVNIVHNILFIEWFHGRSSMIQTTLLVLSSELNLKGKWNDLETSVKWNFPAMKNVENVENLENLGSSKEISSKLWEKNVKANDAIPQNLSKSFSFSLRSR